MSGGDWRLQRYVLGRTLAGLGVGLALICAIIGLIEFVDISRGLGDAEPTFPRLLLLVLMRSPAAVLVLAPFAILFGVALAFVDLNRAGELVAMRAAGVSAWRVILAPALLALVIGAATPSLLSPAALALNDRYEAAKAVLEGHVRAPREVWLRQAEGTGQTVIHAASADLANGAVRLLDVTLFVQRATGGGGLDVTRRLRADEARLTPGFWKLSNVREAVPGSGWLRTDERMLPTALDPRFAVEAFSPAAETPVWRLPAVIRQAGLAGLPTGSYSLRLQQLLATPLLYCAMAVLAAAFSLRLMRMGHLAIVAGLGVGVGFLIFFVDQLCAALAGAAMLPPAVAAWTAPLLALLSGITLLCYTEDG